jgi:hypothetical protein
VHEQYGCAKISSVDVPAIRWARDAAEGHFGGAGCWSPGVESKSSVRRSDASIAAEAISRTADAAAIRIRLAGIWRLRVSLAIPVTWSSQWLVRRGATP